MTPLTPRQREVLRYLADGKTLAETAQILGLSPHTVHAHQERIYDRLDVRNRAQMGVAAVRMGLI